MGESWAPVLARGCPPRAECCHRTVSPDLKGQAQAAVPGLDAFPTHSPAGSGSTPDRASDQMLEHQIRQRETFLQLQGSLCVAAGVCSQSLPSF